MTFLIISNHSYMLWQFRRELIGELLRHGEVVISTPFVGHEDDLVSLGCRCIDTPVDRRGSDPFRDLALLKKYKKLISEVKPDAVIAYSIKPNIYGGLACRRENIPFFANIQGLGTAFQSKMMASFVTRLYRTALKKAKAVFFENEADAGKFMIKRIIPERKIKILHGAGVNLSFYRFVPYPDESEGIRFLFIGRIMKEKGIDEFTSAAERLHKEGAKAIFDVVGFFEDEYMARIIALRDRKIINYPGFAEDPRPYYRDCDCVVLPSYHEGMSNVLLEAAATGRALITSDIPGCREAVDANVTGLLCEPGNSDDLYNKMKAFISMTAEERALMGVRGREKMGRCFDKTDVVAETAGIIFGYLN